MARRLNDRSANCTGITGWEPKPTIPKLRFAHNGPVQRYLAFVGSNQDQFEKALKEKSPNAVSLFAADVVFQELQRLADALEFHQEDYTHREKSNEI